MQVVLTSESGGGWIGNSDAGQACCDLSGTLTPTVRARVVGGGGGRGKRDSRVPSPAATGRGAAGEVVEGDLGSPPLARHPHVCAACLLVSPPPPRLNRELLLWSSIHTCVPLVLSSPLSLLCTRRLGACLSLHLFPSTTCVASQPDHVVLPLSLDLYFCCPRPPPPVHTFTDHVVLPLPNHRPSGLSNPRCGGACDRLRDQRHGVGPAELNCQQPFLLPVLKGNGDGEGEGGFEIKDVVWPTTPPSSSSQR